MRVQGLGFRGHSKAYWGLVGNKGINNIGVIKGISALLP